MSKAADPPLASSIPGKTPIPPPCPNMALFLPITVIGEFHESTVEDFSGLGVRAEVERDELWI